MILYADGDHGIAIAQSRYDTILIHRGNQYIAGSPVQSVVLYGFIDLGLIILVLGLIGDLQLITFASTQIQGRFDLHLRDLCTAASDQAYGHRCHNANGSNLLQFHKLSPFHVVFLDMIPPSAASPLFLCLNYTP